MTAEEIRNMFGWNSVYSTGQSGFPERDLQQIISLQILAMGELAAQLAESREHLFEVK